MHSFESLQEMARQHVQELITSRQDILDSYRTGDGDWVYTEESLSQELSGHEYFVVLRLVFEGLQLHGVKKPPASLLDATNHPSSSS